MTTRNAFRLVAGLAWLATATACTSILGIDGDYVEGVSKASGGSKSSGGADAGSKDAASNETGGTGGIVESGGGSPASGGEGGAAGGGGTSAVTPEDAGACAHCGAAEKCCVNRCVEPSPLFGCSLTSCDTCSALPDNASGICDGTQCSFDCITGFTKVGSTCVAKTAGTGGATGTGGTSAACVAGTCPVCVGTPIYSACCQANGTCGCAFPGAPCFPN